MLHMEAVRPSEGKSAAPEDPDGEIRGNRGSPTRMRDKDLLHGPLQQASYNASQDVAPNPRSLVQSPYYHILSYKGALERTGCESIEITLRTRSLLWSGTLLRMSYHRLYRSVMSRELENAGKHGPGGKNKEWADRVAEDRRMFGITGGWSTAALDPVFCYSTVCKGGCRCLAAWVREEEKASENRRRKK